MAPLPYCIEPGPRKTSIRSRLSGEIVAKYWLGPERKVELFSLTPSIWMKFWYPVKPRSNGDPCPTVVCCAQTPTVSRINRGVMPAFIRPICCWLITEIAFGVRKVSFSTRVAVTATSCN